MGWTVATTGRKLYPMNGVDISRCMDAAHHADPFRGRTWVKTFIRVARNIGYVHNPKAPCRCRSRVCRPECGLGKLK